MKQGPKSAEKPPTKVTRDPVSKPAKKDNELSVKDLDKATGGTPPRAWEEIKK